MYRLSTPLAMATALFFCANGAIASPLLTVTLGDETREYDIPALQELGAVEMATTTIWTEGVQKFTGVPLASVLNDAGITEGSVTATAINEYSIDIPVSEITEEYPIIAFHLDGEPMSVRDKGPFWIVYPFDAAPEWRSEVNFSRSIWQLDRLQPTD